jgi:hypothetical protein
MEHWRDLYTAAILECDPDKLQDFVRAAEQASRPACFRNTCTAVPRVALAKLPACRQRHPNSARLGVTP